MNNMKNDDMIQIIRICGTLKNYDDVLLPEDVQQILRTGRNTVYEYLSTGEIKSIKIGGKYRIPKIYLLEFLYPNIDFSEGKSA